MYVRFDENCPLYTYIFFPYYVYINNGITEIRERMYSM